MVIAREWRRLARGSARAAVWAAATATGLLSASLWLNVPRVDYLAVCAVATVAAAWGAWGLRGARLWWAAAAVAALAAGTGVATREQLVLRNIDGRWTRYRRAIEERSIHMLRGELRKSVDALDADARAALDAPTDAARAFQQLLPYQGREERGVAVYDRGQLFAWGGRHRLLADRADDSLWVEAAPPFYLVVHRSVQRGTRRAVASGLVYAGPPADRLARSVASRVADAAHVAGFAFTPPAGLTTTGGATRIFIDGVALFDARPVAPTPEQARLLALERARVRVGGLLFLVLAGFVVAAWRGARSLPLRLGALAVALACVALLPLNEYSSRFRLFDPTLYYTPLGRTLTANAGALGLTSALVLLGLLALLRRRAPARGKVIPALVVLVVAGGGPFLLRDLARGIRVPATGAGTVLWLIWQVPLFLAAASVLLAGAMAGGALLGRRRGLVPAVAPAIAACAAIIGPIVWSAPAAWPWWYTLLWTGAVAALAFTRQGRDVLASTATVAALGATTLVWANTTRGRVAEARRDVSSLGEVDQTALTLLQRLAPALDASPPTSRQALLQQYVTSDLAAAGYPVVLITWLEGAGPLGAVRTADVSVSDTAVASTVAEARRAGQPVVRAVAERPMTLLVLAAPGPGDTSAAVVVAPRTRLIQPDPIAQLLGLDTSGAEDPPYSLQLGPALVGEPLVGPVWRRVGSELHGDIPVRVGGAPGRAHVEVELRTLDALIERGALLVVLDLAIVGLLWLVAVVADGGVARWLRVRQRSWRRSYRARLTVALLGFFVVPAGAFATWAYRQLSVDTRRSRELLVRETLRAVDPTDDGGDWMEAESRRLGTPLLRYDGGVLAGASDSLYVALAPIGRLLPAPAWRDLALEGEATTSRVERVGPRQTLFGFRVVEGAGPTSALAAPALEGELGLERRRRDLAILVLFATAVGGLAALWLSGVAARQLAQPISALRGAALAIARGDGEPPLAGEPTAEFRPVFTAFRRMAYDLASSRSALEAAQRRTAAVLRNVASGVVAVDDQGRIALANPRAEALLHASLGSGELLSRATAATAPALAALVARFLASRREEEDFELELHEQQLRGRLTRLGQGGAVVTLDDVTALARAQRVLAWGEMARQVAHEIKNPLTPIRLGVQHLRRAYATRRDDYETILDANVGRILGEIDRLDEIARAFSRYGTAPAEREPAEPTDVARVVRDVVALESMGEGEVQWRVRGAEEPATAMARAGELRDVLVNLLENARLANARLVEVELAHDDGVVSLAVRDDGDGIPAEVLPRIFEPHFSTRTSGSGLGLAISRRLIDGWGGRIGVESEMGKGTVVRVELPAV